MSIENTPLDSFLNHKADTDMQCGNYSIDIPELKEGEQYRFHFDATACVGCHCCEAACNEQNANTADIKWRRVGEMETGIFPEVSQIFNSMSCNHCIDPECLNGCPTESYVKFDNGIVFHDDESCIGCQYCTWNCPYEVPAFNPDRGIVTKCHMCTDKLVVNKEQWLKNDMAKQGVAPHLPDIDITKPTTRYTLPENINEKDFKPADEHITKPAHSELPLVFMTVLTQMSVGAMVALGLGESLSIFGFDNLARGSFLLSIFIILPALIGLPLSALHLGRPLLAYTAMKNWRNSWLSREALALGIYAGFGNILVFAYFIESSFLIFTSILGACISGVYGIYAQSMIYRIKARPSWNKESTTHAFLTTGYLGLLLVSLILVIQDFHASSMVILSLTMLMSAYQILIVRDEKNYYAYLQEDEKNFYQLNKTKFLLENNFKKHSKIRYISLILFGLILPLFSILLLANFSLETATLFLFISFIGATTSEFIGRYLFYVSVVPLGLAGNFFAGNQRGRDYKQNDKKDSHA